MRRRSSAWIVVALIVSIALDASAGGSSLLGATAQYLYLETPTGSIATYRIGSDGALDLTGSLAPKWPPNVQFRYPEGVFFAIQPGGRYACSSRIFDGTFFLQHFLIDQSTGVLKRDAANASPPIPFQGPLAFSPKGDFLYVDNPGSGFDPYLIDAKGTLRRAGARVLMPGGPLRAPVFAASSRYAYVLRSQSNNVVSYRVANDGSMTPTDRSGVVPTGASPTSLAVDPGGHFAYVANSRDDTISQYFIDPQTGALRVNPRENLIFSEPYPGSLVIDATGRFLYGINAPNRAPLESFAIFQYRIDDDGKLSPIADPLKIPGSILNYDHMVTETSGKFLYLPITPPSRDSIPTTLLVGFRIGEDGHVESLSLPPIPILDDTAPAVSWIGSKPVVQVIERDVSSLLQSKPPTQGVFRVVGRMMQRRDARGSSSVLMADGRVFFLQAANEWGKFSAEIYDPATQAFSQHRLPAMMTDAYVASELPQHRFLIWFPNRHNDAAIFDPDKMTLTPKGRLSAKCHGFAQLLDDGRVLFHYMPQFSRFNACGGEIYNPRSGQSLEEPRDLRNMNILAEIGRDQLLVFPRPTRFSPVSPNDAPTTVPISIYHLDSHRVESIGDLPGRLAHYNEHITLRDGRLLLVGTVLEQDIMEVFDPRSRKFISAGRLPHLHGPGLGLTLLNDGRVLISGGYYRTNAEILDPETMTSTPTGTMLECRNAKGILLHDGTVLFAGGVIDGSANWPDDAEIYYPPAAKPR